MLGVNETAAVVFGDLAVDNGKQQQWRPGASEQLDMSLCPRHTISMIAGCCLMLVGSLAAAQSASDVDVAYEPCADSVRVVAPDSTLANVIVSMAQEMGFELRFDAAADRALSIDTAGSEQDVIRRLTRDANVMVFTTADNRCADGLMVSNVWFIGAGEAVTVAAAIPRPIPVTTPPSVQLSQADRPEGDDEREEKKERKRRKDMSPEERYYDKIVRQNRKRYGE